MALPAHRGYGSAPRVASGVLSTIVLGLLVLVGCGDDPTGPPGAGVAVFSVSPDVLRPGQEAVLDGQEFAPTPEGNEVRIHGERVTVLEASTSRLRVRLPEFVCAPEGEAPIVVTVAGAESDPFLRAFEPVGVLELAPGEFHLAASPADLCMIVGPSAEGAEYLVGAQSTSESPEVLTGVSVQGRVPGPPSATGGLVARARGDRDVSGIGAGTSGGRLAPHVHVGSPAGGWGGDVLAGDRWLRHQHAEAALRADERELARRILRAPAAPRAATVAAAAAPKVPPTVQPGDVLDLMVPDVSEDGNSCTQGREIEGIVRRVGSRSIWIEDRENPSGGFTADDYQRLADEFDSEIYDETTSYFGQPTDLDDNDRIVVIVTREVNRMSRALAFVALSDFFPDECAGANGGEYYYARAPDPQGTITGPDDETRAYSRSAALSDAPRLLAHEVTHIIQFGRRLQLPNPDGIFQAIWLLEGQSTLAEEVVGHRYTGARPRSNLGAFTALETDHPPTGVPWYQVPFFDLGVYYGFDAEEGAPEECSWLSVEDPEPCVSGRIAYGVTWSFLRWMTDHFHERFGGGEREMQRRIVDSPRWGFATFADVLGEDPTALLAPWAATLYADERVDGDPLLTFPSWDMRDIEARLVDAAHLRPDRFAFENFERTVQVAAASSYYHLVQAEAGHPPFALAARTTTDGTLPDFMQLWVARIR